MSKRIAISFVCVAIVALISMPGASLAKHNGGKWATSESWTIALYISGDNNLERFWDDVSLASLIKLPANDMLTIVAYIDRLSVDGTEIVEISGSECTTVGNLAEKDFGNGDTFRWFLEDVTTNYSSDKLAVVAWDHGYAWRYISDDETSDGTRITMPAFQEAIEAAGVHIDVLAFDACNMASVEVAYQVSLTGLVDIMVASEESVPTTGYPYDLMLMETALDTSRTPEELAADMVSGYENLYADQTWASTVALSAVDLSSLGDSMDTIEAWVGAVHDCLPMYEENYKLALKEACTVWSAHCHVDMADLGETLLADPLITDSGLRAFTLEMVSALDGAVIANWDADPEDPSHGLSLWWGYGGDWKTYSEAYSEVAFAIDTGWWNLLEEYN